MEQLIGEAGLVTFPCHPDKRPATGGKTWKTGMPVDPGRDTHYGIACGGPAGIVVVDVDDQEAWWLWHAGLLRVEGLPLTLTTQTPGGGFHLYFRVPAPARVTDIRNGVKVLPGADVRSEGGYVIGPGSVGYDLAPESALEIVEMPAWLHEAITSAQSAHGTDDDAADADADAVVARIAATRDRESDPFGCRMDEVNLELALGEHPAWPGGAVEIFRAAVERVEGGTGIAKRVGAEWHGPCPHCGEGDDRFRLQEDGGRDGDGGTPFALCRQCGRRCDMCDLVHVSVTGRPMGRRGDALGTLVYLGRADGLDGARSVGTGSHEPGDEGVFSEVDLVWGLGDGDADHAERIRRLHGGALRFLPELSSRDRGVAPSGWWVAWDEEQGRWVEDIGASCVQRVLHVGVVVEEMFWEGLTEAEVAMVKSSRAMVPVEMRDQWDRLNGKLRAIRGLRGVNKSAAALKMLRTDPRVQAHLDAFDRVPHLLGTPGGGVVDLRTGEALAADPERLMMKSSRAPWPAEGLECPAPLWGRFIREITAGDAELAGFLQRMAGSAVIGECLDQYLFVLHGTGANGKSVFCETLRWVLGDYARVGRASALLRQRGLTSAGAREDLAALAGVRLVPMEEPSRGVALDDSTLKEMLSGTEISCRKNFGHEFQFKPQHSLWLACNHIPDIEAHDDGLWRRLLLVPFLVSFLGREDESLAEKLRTEAPGILAWVVRGAIDRYTFGLQIPAALRERTAEHRKETDFPAKFLEDRVEEEPGGQVSSSEMYSEYRAWCIGMKIDHALSHRGFAMEMLRCGLEKMRLSKGVVFLGVRIAGRG